MVRDVRFEKRPDRVARSAPGIYHSPANEMAAVEILERARTLFAQQAWAESCRLFEAADRDHALDCEDLERLATAAYLAGRDDEGETFRERAHLGFVQRQDLEGAARSAFWLAFSLLQRGSRAPASGWLARAERILEERQLDSVVRGYLLIPSAIERIVRGDPAAACAMFGQSADIARRFDDRDLLALACHGRGRALIRLGQTAEGVAVLDEAMVAVLAGDVSPMLAGDVYCSVLEGCQEIFDLRRAYEWTASMARWCGGQQDLIRYRGECLLYRAEVMQLRGKWSDAAHDAHDACELLQARPVAGAAFYRVAEIHRLRGEFADAERAYTRANECGRKPFPGLSLLRLAQGDTQNAAASIRAVLVSTQARSARARILSAAVDIFLAAGDLDDARAAAAELSELAAALGAPLLVAASSHARGAVLLRENDMDGASAALRTAWEIWRDLEMPYEEAQTRLLMAVVCQRQSNRDGQRLELDAAKRILNQLNAAPALVETAPAPTRRTDRAVGSLSEREVQVLRLLAAGKTNRDIGDELFISEKTVARHVSNIFDKLGVSSRASATAWAYQRNLV
jgi:ATP/maltotriose-dependent transcriptional regulator MalT